MDYFLIGFVVVLTLTILWILRPKTPKINPKVRIKALRQIQETHTLDPAHSVMESHKIFVAALKSLSKHKPINAAKIITQLEKYFPHSKKIWQYHRLRNRIAHEVEIKVTTSQAQEAREVFSRALKALA